MYTYTMIDDFGNLRVSRIRFLAAARESIGRNKRHQVLVVEEFQGWNGVVWADSPESGPIMGMSW